MNAYDMWLESPEDVQTLAEKLYDDPAEYVKEAAYVLVRLSHLLRDAQERLRV